MPGVIGCIDCTHIAIVKPDNDEHLFFNRKGYHSLNVQMVSYTLSEYYGLVLGFLHSAKTYFLSCRLKVPIYILSRNNCLWLLKYKKHKILVSNNVIVV